MANENVQPDSLASKAFLITFIGAVLYFTTVFVFVINGDLGSAPQKSNLVEDIHD
jgi:hypothetical protein